jgi:hypothetical protein
LLLRSPSRHRRIATVKPAERTRRDHADDKNPQTQSNDVIRGTQVEVTHTADKDIAEVAGSSSI